MTVVDDAADPRLADFQDLRDPELRRLRATGRGGDYLVAEGNLVVRELLRSPYPVRAVMVTRRGLTGLADDLAAVAAPVHLVTQDVAARVAGFEFHRGALASADRLPDPGLDAVVDGVDLAVLAEGVADNENLGALFRNAAAFGAGAVMVDRTSADPLYRRCIRVSMGQALRIPFTRIGSVPAAMAALRARDYEILALTPSGDTELNAVPRRPRQVLVVGAEGAGLPPASLAAADRRIRIAMAGPVDSLNVATAAAVALHRLIRAGPPR